MLNIMKNGVFGLLEAHQLKHLLIDAMKFAEILVHRVYGAVHLVTATFGQWLCSRQIMVGKFFKFS